MATAPDTPYHFPPRHVRTFDTGAVSADVDLTAQSGCPPFGPTRIYAYLDTGQSDDETLTLFVEEAGNSSAVSLSVVIPGSAVADTAAPFQVKLDSQGFTGIDDSLSGANIRLICEWRYRGSYTLNA